MKLFNPFKKLDKYLLLNFPNLWELKFLWWLLVFIPLSFFPSILIDFYHIDIYSTPEWTGFFSVAFMIICVLGLLHILGLVRLNVRFRKTGYLSSMVALLVTMVVAAWIVLFANSFEYFLKKKVRETAKTENWESIYAKLLSGKAQFYHADNLYFSGMYSNVNYSGKMYPEGHPLHDQSRQLDGLNFKYLQLTENELAHIRSIRNAADFVKTQWEKTTYDTIVDYNTAKLQGGVFSEVAVVQGQGLAVEKVTVRLVDYNYFLNNLRSLWPEDLILKEEVVSFVESRLKGEDGFVSDNFNKFFSICERRNNRCVDEDFFYYQYVLKHPYFEPLFNEIDTAPNSIGELKASLFFGLFVNNNIYRNEYEPARFQEFEAGEVPNLLLQVERDMSEMKNMAGSKYYSDNVLQVLFFVFGILTVIFFSIIQYGFRNFINGIIAAFLFFIFLILVSEAFGGINDRGMFTGIYALFVLLLFLSLMPGYLFFKSIKKFEKYILLIIPVVTLATASIYIHPEETDVYYFDADRTSMFNVSVLMATLVILPLIANLYQKLQRYPKAK